MISAFYKKLRSNAGLWQMIIYVFCGALTTAVNFLSYTVLHYAAGIEKTPANNTAIVLAILFAYVVNKRYVFKSRRETLAGLAAEFAAFAGARALSMIVEGGGFFILVELWGWNDYLAKTFIAVFVLVLNFLFSKLIVFRKGKSGDTQSVH
ncbi:MAG: GtrA family protein [Eubacteriales bacterium]